MTTAALFDLTRQGRQALLRLDRDAAEACFREALAAQADFVDARAGLGQVAYERGELSAAKKYFRDAVAAALRSLGGAWPARLKPHDDRERAFLRAIHGLGLVLYRLKDAAGARQWLELEQRLDPSDVQGSRYVLRNLDAHRPWSATGR